MSDMPMRPLPSLSAAMPMYDVLQLFKTGRSHMALLCEASDGAPPPSRPVVDAMARVTACPGNPLFLW